MQKPLPGPSKLEWGKLILHGIIRGFEITNTYFWNVSQSCMNAKRLRHLRVKALNIDYNNNSIYRNVEFSIVIINERKKN